MLADIVQLLGQGSTVNSYQVTPGATATGAGMAFQFRPRHSHNNFKAAGFLQSAAFQGVVLAPSVTAVSASINIEVSQDGVNWLVYATIGLSGNASGSIVYGTGTGPTDGITLQAPWQYVRGNVTAISGTGAVAFLTMGVA